MAKQWFDVKKLQKPKVTLYGLYLARPVSRRITKLLYRTDITPNQASVFSLFLGIVASVFLLFDYNYACAIFLYFAFVFDCVDGELARLKEQFTKLGYWMEGALDRIPEILPLLVMGHLTGAWAFTAFAITNILLIRSSKYTRSLLLEKFNLQEDGLSRYKTLVEKPQPKRIISWLGYTSALNYLILIVGILTKQYLPILVGFSVIGFPYYLITSFVIIRYYRHLDRSNHLNEKRRNKDSSYSEERD